MGDFQRERCRFVGNSLDKIYYQVRGQSGNSLSSGGPTPSPPQPLHEELQKLNDSHSPDNPNLLQDASEVYQRLLNDLQQQLQPNAYPENPLSMNNSANFELNSMIFPPPPPPLTCVTAMPPMTTLGVASPLGRSLMSLPEDKQVELQQLSMTISKLQQQLTAGLQSAGLLNSSMNKSPAPWNGSLNESWNTHHSPAYGTITGKTELISAPLRPRVTFADQVVCQSPSHSENAPQTNHSTLENSRQINTSTRNNDLKNNSVNDESDNDQNLDESQKLNKKDNDEQDDISVYDNVFESTDCGNELLSISIKA